MRTTRTWKERIIDATSGRNQHGQFLWYTHATIGRLIAEDEGISPKYKTLQSLSLFLLSLIKSGHIERADMPRSMRTALFDLTRRNYVYRRTGKTYARNLEAFNNPKDRYRSNGGLVAHDVWRLNSKLPKWYRSMMMD